MQGNQIKGLRFRYKSINTKQFSVLAVITRRKLELHELDSFIIKYNEILEMK